MTSFFCELIERRYCPSLAADLAQLAPAGAGAAQAPVLPPLRLSAERLPPVMVSAGVCGRAAACSWRPSLILGPKPTSCWALNRAAY